MLKDIDGAPLRYTPLPAQMRCLRNWEPEELHENVLEATAIALGTSSAGAKLVVESLVLRHEALRSSLAVKTSDGSPDTALIQVADEKRSNAITRDARRDEYLVPVETRSFNWYSTTRGEDTQITIRIAHLFCDQVGVQILEHDLVAATKGQLPQSTAARPSDYALPTARSEALDTARVMADAVGPVYKPHRTEPLPVPLVLEGSPVYLQQSDSRALRIAARKARVPELTLYLAATCLAVANALGEPRTRAVLRIQCSNRMSEADFSLVAQMAQPTFVPIEFTSASSLVHVAKEIALQISRPYVNHSYDDEEFTRRLQSVIGEVAFHPWLEANIVTGDSRSHAEMTTARRQLMRTRPIRAKAADLSLEVSSASGRVCICVYTPVDAPPAAGTLEMVGVTNAVCNLLRHETSVDSGSLGHA
jgi:hypothetical protein